MATKKPSFTFHIADKYLKKIRIIAQREIRSSSNMLEHICKLYIEQYEQEHGEIPLEREEIETQ